MITVVVCDDEALVRGGFRLILEAQPDIEVVGEAATGREAIEEVALRKPDVVLMDIRMPGDGWDRGDPPHPRRRTGAADLDPHHLRSRVG